MMTTSNDVRNCIRKLQTTKSLRKTNLIFFFSVFIALIIGITIGNANVEEGDF